MKYTHMSLGDFISRSGKALLQLRNDCCNDFTMPDGCISTRYVWNLYVFSLPNHEYVRTVTFQTYVLAEKYIIERWEDD